MTGSAKDFDEPEIQSDVDQLRHSVAHIMAHAVSNIWPQAKFGIGPTIENGFYYDMDIEGVQLTPEDLKKIEGEMKKVMAQGQPFVRSEHSIEEAKTLFQDQPYKLEIIETLAQQTGTTSVSSYAEGDFTDLCRGPHIEKARKGIPFKLLSVAGAYWRGDEKRPMMQRIYGTAFLNKEDLKEHLHLLEEAKKRDHRKLGKELDLFSFHIQAPGGPFFHPKGARLYRTLVEYVRELYEQYGYQEVITPQVLDVELWKTSGHYENYRENMYFTEIDDREFALKPMNCPAHALLFGAKRHSYRELPLRIADFGRLHRFERSGVMHGLTRVRTFCQDDAHIFCTFDQIQQEVRGCIDMILGAYDLFGFTTEIFLATRPEKKVGSDDLWDKAEAALKRALDELGRPYKINEGDGAFYGPKVDFIVRDALKREWQLGTAQLDFNLPERFDLNFVGQDNGSHRPVMIHRAVLGSLERFIGVIIEHYGGAFPFWLAPVQVRLITITDDHRDYCNEFAGKLREQGFRVEIDERNESMGMKIREVQKAKIPYALVAGDREKEAGRFAVRKYGEKDSTELSHDQILALFTELKDAKR